MKIDFTAPVGPKKFLRRRREELAAIRFTRIGVEQLGATLGAEISNVDLRRPLDDETLAEIERALLAFKVLFVRTCRRPSTRRSAGASASSRSSPSSPAPTACRSTSRGDREVRDRGLSPVRQLDVQAAGRDDRAAAALEPTAQAAADRQDIRAHRTAPQGSGKP
jgi:hypothetical protein